MWTADVARAYRQLRADPLSVPLFRITLDGVGYVDMALPFGCRTSRAGVRVMSAITWIMSRRGHHALVYVDDFVGCEATYLNARRAFHALASLCAELGIALTPKKCVPPAIDRVWLGLYLDSSEMTISIPAAKLDAVISECDRWMTRPSMTVPPVQCLLGRLAQVASCIPQARRFGSLRGLHAPPPREAPDDAGLGADVSSFRRYACESNGVHLLPLGAAHMGQRV